MLVEPLGEVGVVSETTKIGILISIGLICMYTLLFNTMQFLSNEYKHAGVYMQVAFSIIFNVSFYSARTAINYLCDSNIARQNFLFAGDNYTNLPDTSTTSVNSQPSQYSNTLIATHMTCPPVKDNFRFRICC
eukprot:UN32496